MLFTVFGWVGTVLSLVGFYVNVKKSKWGFVLWLITDIIFAITSAATHTWYFVTLYIIYAILAVWGYRQWTKPSGM
jgi:nicotinamide riboside transporter PnuC